MIIGRRSGIVGDSKGFSHEYSAPHYRHSVVVEDDGKVGYAYLIDESGRICADVWLYNRCPAPVKSNWENQEAVPFANPIAYIHNAPQFLLPDGSSDISVDWDSDKAKIMIGNQVIGVLIDGSRPGWAIQARNDGPLAKVLLDDIK